jgi:hypothetical protein
VIALLPFWFDLVLAFVAPRAALVAENLILRQQLIVIRRQIKRPRLRRFDRWLIGALAGRLAPRSSAAFIIATVSASLPGPLRRWKSVPLELGWSYCDALVRAGQLSDQRVGLAYHPLRTARANAPNERAAPMGRTAKTATAEKLLPLTTAHRLRSESGRLSGRCS